MKGKTFRYTDKDWYIVTTPLQSERQVALLKQYFGLPQDTILEWYKDIGNILVGAHRHIKNGVEHYTLRKGHSTVEWINFRKN